MKLELKHICGYLPYGLKAITTCVSYKNPSVGIVDYWSIHGNVENEISILADHGYYLCEIKDCKPILRPMSDLYKEIDGAVHIVELAKIATSKTLSDKGDWELGNEYDWFGNAFRVVRNSFSLAIFYYHEKTQSFHFSSNGVEIHASRLRLFNYLFEHHFDIYGLIDKGLAIDINSLSQ